MLIILEELCDLVHSVLQIRDHNQAMPVPNLIMGVVQPFTSLKTWQPAFRW